MPTGVRLTEAQKAEIWKYKDTRYPAVIANDLGLNRATVAHYIKKREKSEGIDSS